jgi:hypothetical protein
LRRLAMESLVEISVALVILALETVRSHRHCLGRRLETQRMVKIVLLRRCLRETEAAEGIKKRDECQKSRRPGGNECRETLKKISTIP